MSRPTPKVSTVSSVPRKITSWETARSNEHFIQFYRTEEYLIECLAGYVADGLAKGEKVIIIATPAHRIALEARLRLKQVDVLFATATGQLLSVDAEEALGKFMINGKPDREAFRRTVGELVVRATADGKKLRAFGEMVALLWLSGNRTAAVELEQIWNDLGRDHQFMLFCAYPSSCTDSKGDGPSLEHVCGAHSCVISMTA